MNVKNRLFHTLEVLVVFEFFRLRAVCSDNNSTLINQLSSRAICINLSSELYRSIRWVRYGQLNILTCINCTLNVYCIPYICVGWYYNHIIPVYCNCRLTWIIFWSWRSNDCFTLYAQFATYAYHVNVKNRLFHTLEVLVVFEFFRLRAVCSDNNSTLINQLSSRAICINLSSELYRSIRWVRYGQLNILTCINCTLNVYCIPYICVGWYYNHIIPVYCNCRLTWIFYCWALGQGQIENLYAVATICSLQNNSIRTWEWSRICVTIPLISTASIYSIFYFYWLIDSQVQFLYTIAIIVDIAQVESIELCSNLIHKVRIGNGFRDSTWLYGLGYLTHQLYITIIQLQCISQSGIQIIVESQLEVSLIDNHISYIYLIPWLCQLRKFQCLCPI